MWSLQIRNDIAIACIGFEILDKLMRRANRSLNGLHHLPRGYGRLLNIRRRAETDRMTVGEVGVVGWWR